MAPPNGPGAAPPGIRGSGVPLMADVAARAGVSVMTVSRVVNRSAPVSQATRQRVEQAIAELGYRANVAARTLAGGRSRVLGAIGVETTHFGPAHTLYGIEAAAAEAGHTVSLVILREPTAEGMRAAVDQLRSAHVEGIIALTPIRSEIDALADLDAGVPIVVTSDAPPGAASVRIDEHSGARLATAHLLDLGHRRVHHIRGPEGWADGRARVQGWKDEHRERGVEPGRCLTGDWSPESGYRAGRKLAADPDVTAILAANDQMAMGALLALHEAGRRVPHDVSVAGFDDIPEAAFTIPPLTTVRQDFDELGRLSVRRLLAILAGNDAPDDDDRLVAPALVVRQSTAGPPS